MEMKRAKKRKTSSNTEQLFKEIEETVKQSNRLLNPNNPQIGTQIILRNVPEIPSWTNSRRYMGSSFLSPNLRRVSNTQNNQSSQNNENIMRDETDVIEENTSQNVEIKPKQPKKIEISKLPIKVQELIVLEELLSCLMGFETAHFKCIKDPNLSGQLKFIIDPSNSDTNRVNVSVLEIISKILPIATDYLIVNSYVNNFGISYSSGLIVHAFCFCVKKLLKKYLTLICSFETQFYNSTFTLQQLLLKIQGPKKTLSALARICLNTNLRGGKFLKYIHNSSLYLSGDLDIKKLYSYILEKTYEPFNSFLSVWLSEGIVNDKYMEFMICEDNRITKETLKTEFSMAYWNKKYVINNNNCPNSILEKYSKEILTTGKYINVIKESKRIVNERKEREREREYENSNENEKRSKEQKEKRKRNDDIMIDEGEEEDLEEEEEGENEVVIEINEKDEKKVGKSGKGNESFEEFLVKRTIEIDKKYASKEIDEISKNKLKFSKSNEQFTSNEIRNCYNSASKELLKLFLNDFDIKTYFLQLKRYFLFDQGDLFVFFVDIAERELVKNVRDISISKLNSLLDHSLIKTIGSNESLSCKLLDCNLQEYLQQISKIAMRTTKGNSNNNNKFNINDELIDIEYSNINLKGVEALTLDYNVDYPISIVLNKKVLAKYQLMFRHIFFVKYVSRALKNAWIKMKFIKRLRFGKINNNDVMEDEGENNSGGGEGLRILFSLHHKMSNFIHSFEYYIVEIIEKYYSIFQKKLNKAKTNINITSLSALNHAYDENIENIDDLMMEHKKFIDSVLKCSLLSVDINLFRDLSEIMKSCLTYSFFLIQFVRSLKLDQFSMRNVEHVKKIENLILQRIEKSDFKRNVLGYKKKFEKSVQSMLRNLKKNYRVDTEELKRLISIIKFSFKNDNIFQ